MKDSINILFVCGYGVGSSAMLEAVTSKALKARNISANLEHAAAGEVGGYVNWADIVAVNKKLMDIVDLDSFRGKHVIEIENMMDGEGIGNKIQSIVTEHYQYAVKG
ncbi:PTS sugar transporter subunit IIB [Neobacillus niacini]|uniref:PTS sugar transporter subunit IIB n=1 Tax=Neobacillus niacini TaxID=86668 RepID=UPI0021CB2293|nr:hypothetical protein [Neobacillus niacini]MCM3763639.1 hypothetical protein [Neobacillus niacini]